MRRIIILIAALAVTLSASAQQKGDMSVGGVIGISGSSATSTVSAGSTTTKTTLPSTTNFRFSPMFSYFVIDNLELSAGLSYDMTRKASTEGKYTFYDVENVAQFRIGVHYFVNLAKGFYYTPGLELGFGGGSFADFDGEDNIKVTVKLPFAFDCALNLGKFEFRPTEHLGFSINLLDLNFGHNEYQDKEFLENKIKTSKSEFDFGLNYGASVGVRFYF